MVGKNQPNVIEWTEEVEECFNKLKAALSTAPALGLPDYGKPFFLYSHEIKGFAQTVLTQQHGDHQRPIAYFGRRLDPVERGLPLCLQAVAAASYAVKRTAEIVMGHPLILRVPHCVASLLTQKQMQHLTTTRLMQYDTTLLHRPNLRIERCNILNPASLLPTEEDGDPHDCTEVIQVVSTVRPDLKD